MITERDKQIMEYLYAKEVDIIELHNVFWKDKTMSAARKRLNELVNRGHIQKKKDIDDCYTIYFKEGSGWMG